MYARHVRPVFATAVRPFDALCTSLPHQAASNAFRRVRPPGSTIALGPLEKTVWNARITPMQLVGVLVRECPKDTGTDLVPVSRFVPCRTFRWRHIYGSLKTSHWDLQLVPAPFFCHYSRSHIWSRSLHVAFPLTCRLLVFMWPHSFSIRHHLFSD